MRLKEEIKKLNQYKIEHHFKYSEIAFKLGTTTRTLRRWIREGVEPLPIYQRAILNLLKED